jgi:hypothetical protein
VQEVGLPAVGAARPMEPWQLEVLEARLAGGSAVMILTALEDHSRVCLVARGVPRAACEAFAKGASV